MNIEVAKIKGILLLKKYKLYQDDWKIIFNKKLKGLTYGICDFDDKTIYVALNVVKSNDWKWIEEIILHEIVHVLRPPFFKNGRWYIHHSAWKNKCKQISINQNRKALPNTIKNA